MDMKNHKNGIFASLFTRMRYFSVLTDASALNILSFVKIEQTANLKSPQTSDIQQHMRKHVCLGILVDSKT